MKIFTGIKIVLFSVSLAFAGNVFSEEVCDNEAFNFFTDSANGWTQLADNDGNTNPGSGGQIFDAEYLFYKYDESNNNLSIGLQSGFDLIDGQVDVISGDWWNRTKTSYFAGDLALSFDGLPGYEYAVDFGLLTKDYNGNDLVSADTGFDDGVDGAGLYRVTEWNNDILFPESSPFAMDEGTLIAGALTENETGSGVTGSMSGWCGQYIECMSYYRVVTFNLDDVVTQAGDFTVDTHWTMSCGNDYINGSVVLSHNDSAVPEPSILALFSLGSIGLVASGCRRRKMQK